MNQSAKSSRTAILVVDDEELNRALLGQIFGESYDVFYAADGNEALEKFKAHESELAAVLLDLVMPGLDGYQTLLELYSSHATDVIPVIVVTANNDDGIALSCYSIGAAEIINKPFSSKIVRKRVDNMIEMYSSREKLGDMLAISNQKLTEREIQLEEFNDKFIDTISEVVEFRDMESGQHVKRVKGLTGILAKAYTKLYPEKGLTDEKINMIVKSAALHDIGKIVISDTILLKPGRLTPEERKVMESHTTRGCDILEKLKDVQDDEHYQIAYEIVRYHHERYDGRGYPDGLKGDEIPISAALVSVADVYDALTSERCYKKAFSKEKAYDMIVNGECGTFGPVLLSCLEYARAEIEAYKASE